MCRRVVHQRPGLGAVEVTDAGHAEAHQQAHHEERQSADARHRGHAWAGADHPPTVGPAPYDWVSLLTDYGRTDGFVAACHGVIARIAPAVRVIDITHDVPPGDIRRGAAVLAQTVRSLPTAVHVAVVDP